MPSGFRFVSRREGGLHRGGEVVRASYGLEVIESCLSNPHGERRRPIRRARPSLLKGSHRVGSSFYAVARSNCRPRLLMGKVSFLGSQKPEKF